MRGIFWPVKQLLTSQSESVPLN